MSGGANVNSMKPDQEKAKIRDIFIELMEKDGFTNIRINPNNLLKVDYDISPDQSFVKDICGDISFSIVKQKSTKETKKLYTKIKKRANKIEKQNQKEALIIYFKKTGVL